MNKKIVRRHNWTVEIMWPTKGETDLCGISNLDTAIRRIKRGLKYGAYRATITTNRIVALSLLCCTVAILSGCEVKFRDDRKAANEIHKTDEYARGVNDALDSITLLNLEQHLYQTNRTWGAMGEIVAQRLGVERTDRPSK